MTEYLNSWHVGAFVDEWWTTPPEITLLDTIGWHEGGNYREAIKAGVGAIRVKAGAGVLLFLSN